MLAFAVDILQGTPWWAFALLGLLVILGVQALRPRIVPLRRLLATPGIFIGWGLASLVLRLTSGTPLYLVDWLVAGGAGAVLGWASTRRADLRIDPAGVAMPGSVLPLVRNLLIFSAKYVLAVAASIDPGQAQQFAFWDIAVSGAAAGYFLALLAHLLLLYRRASPSRLAA
jgi:hypothetical protein